MTYTKEELDVGFIELMNFLGQKGVAQHTPYDIIQLLHDLNLAIKDEALIQQVVDLHKTGQHETWQQMVIDTLEAKGYVLSQ